MTPKPSCEECPNCKEECHSTCLQWTLYQREKNTAYMQIITERNKSLSILDTEIKRKEAEKRKKRRGK